MDISENSGTPKSSILIGFSIINHPFWGTTIFGNTYMSPFGGFEKHHFKSEKSENIPQPFFTAIMLPWKTAGLFLLIPIATVAS